MVMSLLDASFQEQIKLFIKSIPIKLLRKFIRITSGQFDLMLFLRATR